MPNVDVSSAEAPITDDEAAALFAPLGDFSALLIAVSGGPDSMAALALLHRWSRGRARPSLFAATVDHGLRSGSAEEAEMVAAWCKTIGLPHVILAWQGEKPTTGLMEKAREARSHLLFAHASVVGAQGLVLAHHSDDQAETVLLRLSSGSGLSGLAGMRMADESAQGLKLRPLLAIPKSRLVATCHALNVPFVTDPSNVNDTFARPRLRKVMAALSREGLSRERLLKLAERAASAQEVVMLAAKAARADAALTTWPANGPIVFQAERFLALPQAVQIQLLREAVNERGSEGLPQLARIETLGATLASNAQVRRTLSGLMITKKDGQITLSAAPPRRQNEA